MAIDISKYEAVKANNNATKKSSDSFLNRDLKFGQWSFSDKKKERFYREMHLLFEAGLDIQASLKMIKEESPKQKDSEFFAGIEDDIVAGKSLSQVTQETGHFSAYEYQSIRIGEESGRMEEIFFELSKYFSSRLALKRQLVKVLAYPVFIIGVSVIVIWFMLSYVVPLFEGVFKRFGAELPEITQFVIDLSDGMTKVAPYIFAGVVLLVIFLRSQKNKNWYRSFSAKAMLNAPIFGGLFKKIFMARFSQSMYLLTKSHTPLVNALAMTRDMVNVYPLEQALDVVQEDVVRGMPLNKALSKHKIFDKKLVSLIRVSEEVNLLAKMFGNLSEQYNKEIDHRSSIIGSLMEPIMILVIALFVGFILVSMYLPLFELSRIMR